MWFLWFYVASTVFTLFIIILSDNAIKAKIKRSGIEIPKKDIAVSEKIIALIPAFIPFYNILSAMVLVFIQDRIYDKAIENYKKQNGGK